MKQKESILPIVLAYMPATTSAKERVMVYSKRTRTNNSLFFIRTLHDSSDFGVSGDWDQDDWEDSAHHITHELEMGIEDFVHALRDFIIANGVKK